MDQQHFRFGKKLWIFLLYVKCRNPPKQPINFGRNFTYLEDPGISLKNMFIANQPINPLVNFQQNSWTVKTTKTMADDDISTFDKKHPNFSRGKKTRIRSSIKDSLPLPERIGIGIHGKYGIGPSLWVQGWKRSYDCWLQPKYTNKNPEKLR